MITDSKIFGFSLKLAGDVPGQFKSQWLNPNIFELSEGSVTTISGYPLKILMFSFLATTSVKNAEFRVKNEVFLATPTTSSRIYGATVTASKIVDNTETYRSMQLVAVIGCCCCVKTHKKHSKTCLKIHSHNMTESEAELLQNVLSLLWSFFTNCLIVGV